jgi:hypothetical protein
LDDELFDDSLSKGPKHINFILQTYECDDEGAVTVKFRVWGCEVQDVGVKFRIWD